VFQGLRVRHGGGAPARGLPPSRCRNRSGSATETTFPEGWSTSTQRTSCRSRVRKNRSRFIFDLAFQMRLSRPRQSRLRAWLAPRGNARPSLMKSCGHAAYSSSSTGTCKWPAALPLA
jgi:hypothetical protein